MMNDLFNLKWDKYSQNLFTPMKDLRYDEEHQNVTLVCDDEILTKAHKLVLTMGSPFLKRTLGLIQNNRPVLYIKGIGSQMMKHLLDFIYWGRLVSVIRTLKIFYWQLSI